MTGDSDPETIDMTDDELRAAARVRNSEASGINHHDIYGYSLNVDLAILGRAWLADHPADDGEPVTGDWLMSIGGKPRPFLLARFDHDAEYGSVSFCKDGRVLVDDGGPDTVLPGRYDTRGKVRHLLAALGIPTTPESR